MPEIPIKADELAANDDCMNYLTGGGSVLGKLPSMGLCNITSPQRHIKALKDTLKENSDIKKLSLIVGTNLSIKLTDFYPLFLHILCSSASNFLHFLTVSFTAITESWLQGEQVEFSVRHLAMFRQLALLTKQSLRQASMFSYVYSYSPTCPPVHPPARRQSGKQTLTATVT